MRFRDLDQCHEEAKTLQQMSSLFVELKKEGLSRSSSIAAIGGGVVQDIATLLHRYLCGISWSYVPTTFLVWLILVLVARVLLMLAYKNLIVIFIHQVE